APRFIDAATKSAQQVEAVGVIELITHTARRSGAMSPVLEVVVVVSTLRKVEMLLARQQPILDQFAVKIIARGRALARGAGVGGIDLPAIGFTFALGDKGSTEVEAVGVA